MWLTRSVLPICLILMSSGCTLPENCPGNCKDVCGGKFLDGDECAAEYAEGFNRGFCAGVLNDDRRGDKQGHFVSGYWDGYSEGSILRAKRYINVCTG